MRLRSRLFLAFTLFAVLLLTSLAALFRLSFERGLDQYLTQRQTRQLEALAVEFADFYNRRGDFAGVRLSNLVRSQEGGEAPLPRGLVLIDRDGRNLFGPPLRPEDSIAVPIVLDDKTIGLLALPASDPMRDHLAAEFQQQQQRLLVLAVLPAVILALLASWLISRHIGRPVEKAAAFTGLLARGDYRNRLDESRRDELGELARHMNRLAYALARAGAARERWLADISHELRTPVAILQGELEALIDGVRPTDSAQLKALHERTGHLSRLLNDLHDLALTDAGALRYQFEQGDLGALLRSLVNDLGAQLSRDGLSLSADLVDDALIVSMDATRIRQLLDNLLNNARIHTDAPGRIALTLQRQQQRAVLTLEDSAPGVSDDAITQLFDPMFRAPGAAGRPGSGLGLAICQRIVAAHGGTLVADHAALGGLRLTLTLPLAREHQT